METLTEGGKGKCWGRREVCLAGSLGCLRGDSRAFPVPMENIKDAAVDAYKVRSLFFNKKLRIPKMALRVNEQGGK
jgi:hypothetical protein